jgi:predicted NBD/HSP70 family sugar kinase
MAGKIGNSLLETRRKNLSLIKNMIYRMENATRTAIAEELGLTLPTITTSVNEMIAEGILEEVPIPDEHLTNNMGRRPHAIAFRRDAAYVIGIELGPYATRAVLMDLKGNILESVEKGRASEKYAEMLGMIAEIVESLVKKLADHRLLGVGVGLPGFVDSDKGIVRSNMRKDWIGQCLARDIAERVGYPVLIDNNVRMRAVGHELQNHSVRGDSFAYFYVSKGVACQLVLKYDVVTGHTAGAGEVGHMIISVQKEGQLQQLNVDDLGSERAIFMHCQEAMLAGRLTALKQKIEENGRLTMWQILEVQESGDEEVNQIIENAIEYLGIALANVVNLINPGFVVADSCLFSNEKNKQQLVAAAKSHFFGLNEEEVKIVFAPFDPYRGAVGAGCFVISKLFLDN